MIARHCGVRLIPISENRQGFTKACIKCGKRFTQRKRQAG